MSDRQLLRTYGRVCDDSQWIHDGAARADILRVMHLVAAGDRAGAVAEMDRQGWGDDVDGGNERTAQRLAQAIGIALRDRKER
jgi:hypothetical protein